MQLTQFLTLALLGTVAAGWELSMRVVGEPGTDKRTSKESYKSPKMHRCQLMVPMAPDKVLFKSQESRAQIKFYATDDCGKSGDDDEIHTQCFGEHEVEFDSPGEVARSFKVTWGMSCGSNDK